MAHMVKHWKSRNFRFWPKNRIFQKCLICIELSFWYPKTSLRTLKNHFPPLFDIWWHFERILRKSNFRPFLKILKFWIFTFWSKKPLKTAKNRQKPSFHNLCGLGSKISKMARLTRRNFENPLSFMSVSRFGQNPLKPSNTVLDTKKH